MIRWESTTNSSQYQETLETAIQTYGTIEQRRLYTISFQGKQRKQITIILEDIQINLVNALQDISWYSFFFAEGRDFWARQASTPSRKKEIFYNPAESNAPTFLLDLLHEAAHFPKDKERDANNQEEELHRETQARIKALSLAKQLKETYNICFLAWIGNTSDIYQHIQKQLLTYHK